MTKNSSQNLPPDQGCSQPGVSLPRALSQEWLREDGQLASRPADLVVAVKSEQNSVRPAKRIPIPPKPSVPVPVAVQREARLSQHFCLTSCVLPTLPQLTQGWG